MTPEDKKLAREAIVRNRLTVDQVSEIQKECEATGRSFTEVAIGRGLLRLQDVKALQAPAPSSPVGPSASSDLRKPLAAEAAAQTAKAAGAEAVPKTTKAAKPAKVALVFPVLIAASLAILLGLLIATFVSMRERSRRDQEQAAEAARLRAEGERKSREADMEYKRKTVEERDARAKAALETARAALKRAESADPKAERTFDDPLVVATVNYNTYLDINPDDAAVLVERSRVYALRRIYQRAVDDLERAVALDRTLEPKVRENLQMLRLMLPKK